MKEIRTDGFVFSDAERISNQNTSIGALYSSIGEMQGNTVSNITDESVDSAGGGDGNGVRADEHADVCSINAQPPLDADQVEMLIKNGKSKSLESVTPVGVYGLAADDEGSEFAMFGFGC